MRLRLKFQRSISAIREEKEIDENDDDLEDDEVDQSEEINQNSLSKEDEQAKFVDVAQAPQNKND